MSEIKGKYFPVLDNGFVSLDLSQAKDASYFEKV